MSFLAAAFLAVAGQLLSPRAQTAAAGWETAAPRAEIRPSFDYKPNGGRDGRGAWIISADAREGLDGFWIRSFPVQGGQYYRFQAFRRVHRVATPRQSAVVRLLWQDAQGKPVPRDEPAVTEFLKGFPAMAEAEYPMDKDVDARGWTEVSDLYRAPRNATRAVLELRLQWAPRGRIEWSAISLTESATPPARRVRLATVHFRPQGGKTPAGNCRLFAPLIATAAQQHADLVVLPETLTSYGTGRSLVECAEPVPGPSTDYFGELARRYNLYLVAGLVEREHHLVYNTAVLLGPDGVLVGKYRKVCLPRDEVAAGVAPGHDYPVFDTRFGKLGMMICYDGFFPEVARELSNRGAEVIAWPVWGCNPKLASARACENHVYLVSSTYEDITRNWMISGVFDHQGQAIAKAETWGTIALAEVDLAQRLHWPSLGDFKADLLRHRPLSGTDGEARARHRSRPNP